MNLITKLAYNALTKTIQAIAPGGVSLALPRVISFSRTSTLGGATTSPSVVIRQVKIDDVVTITVAGLGVVTKDGTNGPLTLTIDSEFAPASARSWINVGTINNVQISTLFQVIGSTFYMFLNIAGQNIPSTQTQDGWPNNMSFTYTISN